MIYLAAATIALLIVVINWHHRWAGEDELYHQKVEMVERLQNIVSDEIERLGGPKPIAIDGEEVTV